MVTEINTVSFSFGVCCVFIRTDATRSVSDNCTYIQNPNYPDSFPAGDTSATYTIVKCSPSTTSTSVSFIAEASSDFCWLFLGPDMPVWASRPCWTGH